MTKPDKVPIFKKKAEVKFNGYTLHPSKLGLTASNSYLSAEMRQSRFPSKCFLHEEMVAYIRERCSAGPLMWEVGC